MCPQNPGSPWGKIGEKCSTSKLVLPSSFIHCDIGKGHIIHREVVQDDGHKEFGTCLLKRIPLNLCSWEIEPQPTKTTKMTSAADKNTA